MWQPLESIDRRIEVILSVCQSIEISVKVVQLMAVETFIPPHRLLITVTEHDMQKKWVSLPSSFHLWTPMGHSLFQQMKK